MNTLSQHQAQLQHSGPLLHSQDFPLSRCEWAEALVLWASCLPGSTIPALASSQQVKKAVTSVGALDTRGNAGGQPAHSLLWSPDS